MNAHYWEGDMGEEWQDTEIPDEYREAAETAHHELFEKLADHDESLMEKFVHEEEPTLEEMPRDPSRRSPATASRCSWAPPSRTGRPAAARRDRGLPPVAGGVRPVEGHLPGQAGVERARGHRAVLRLAFKIMSDLTSDA